MCMCVCMGVYIYTYICVCACCLQLFLPIISDVFLAVTEGFFVETFQYKVVQEFVSTLNPKPS